MALKAANIHQNLFRLFSAVKRLKKVSALKIRTSCMCLLRKLLMIWDMLIFSTIHKISLLFRVLRRLLSVLNAEILLYLPISTTL